MSTLAATVVPSQTWGEFSAGCGHRAQPELERRPANALNIEIGTPAARCLARPPDGRGVTRDGSTLAWLRSGGSLLAYGRCAPGPHCARGCVRITTP